MRAGFEWFVAWRHLRDPARKVPRTLVVGLVLLALGIIGILVEARLHEQVTSASPFPSFRSLRYLGYAKVASVVVLALGGLVSFVGTLFAIFTVFTSFSIFGVFLGTAAPIIALSVMSGFEADLKGKIRGSKADVVVETEDERPFTDWQALVDRLRKLPGVVAVTPYLEAEVMLSQGNNHSGAYLRGIEVGGAAQVFDLERKLKEGKLEYLESPPPPTELKAPQIRRLQPTLLPSRPSADAGTAAIPPEEPAPSDADEEEGQDSEADEAEATAEAVVPRELPGIIVGEEIFQRILRLWTGDTLDVTCPMCGVGPIGPIPRRRSFRVVGHFYTGMYEFDSKFVYVALREAQRFLDMPGEITGIDIRTATPELARGVADTISAQFGKSYTVRSWEDLNRALFRALKLEKIAMFIALAFIALVASFSIISNLFMLVTEKGREVAILKSMGASDFGILRLFLYEGLYIGLIGMSTGVLVGVATCLAMGKWGLRLPEDIYYIHQLPVTMQPLEIVAIAFVALALSCLAALYPALLASRLRPVAGLRYE